GPTRGPAGSAPAAQAAAAAAQAAAEPDHGEEDRQGGAQHVRRAGRVLQDQGRAARPADRGQGREEGRDPARRAETGNGQPGRPAAVTRGQKPESRTIEAEVRRVVAAKWHNSHKKEGSGNPAAPWFLSSLL